MKILTIFTASALASKKLLNIHEKSQQFQHLLKAPFQVALRNHFTDPNVEVKSIDQTSVEIDDLDELEVSATLTLATGDICRISTDLNLLDMTMDDTEVECTSKNQENELKWNFL